MLKPGELRVLETALTALSSLQIFQDGNYNGAGTTYTFGAHLQAVLDAQLRREVRMLPWVHNAHACVPLAQGAA